MHLELMKYLEIFIDTFVVSGLVYIVTRSTASFFSIAIFSIGIFGISITYFNLSMIKSIEYIYTHKGAFGFLNIFIFAICVYIAGEIFKRKTRMTKDDISDLYEYAVLFTVTNIFFFYNYIPYLVYIFVFVIVLYSNMEYDAINNVAKSKKL